MVGLWDGGIYIFRKARNGTETKRELLWLAYPDCTIYIYAPAITFNVFKRKTDLPSASVH